MGDVEAKSGFGDFELNPCGGSKAQIGAKFGHLGPCYGIWKLQLCFLGQGWGILRAIKLAGGHIEAKLGMLCHVEAICQILFGHVVGFASRNALPPAGPRL